MVNDKKTRLILLMAAADLSDGGESFRWCSSLLKHGELLMPVAGSGKTSVSRDDFRGKSSGSSFFERFFRDYNVKKQFSLGENGQFSHGTYSMFDDDRLVPLRISKREQKDKGIIMDQSFLMVPAWWFAKKQEERNKVVFLLCRIPTWIALVLLPRIFDYKKPSKSI